MDTAAQAAHMLWIDQPVGVGFSYADPPAGAAAGAPPVIDRNEWDVRDDMYEFLQLFLVTHPRMAQRPFLMAGESYAGAAPGAANAANAVCVCVCVCVLC